MTQTEVLKQLREVHALQGRDGCWDIDDYMLGLYNGLELVLSIVENRECRYKQRPKSQPEQEPVAWMTIDSNGEEDDIWYDNPEGKLLEGWSCKPLYTRPRTWVGLTDDECKKIWLNLPYEVYHDEIRMIEQIIKDKNT